MCYGDWRESIRSYPPPSCVTSPQEMESDNNRMILTIRKFQSFQINRSFSKHLRKSLRPDRIDGEIFEKESRDSRVSLGRFVVAVVRVIQISIV